MNSWVQGSEAEGSFYIKIGKSPHTKTGEQIGFKFQLTQHSRDILLMDRIADYFGCGKVEKVRGVLRSPAE